MIDVLSCFPWLSKRARQSVFGILCISISSLSFGMGRCWRQLKEFAKFLVFDGNYSRNFKGLEFRRNVIMNYLNYMLNYCWIFSVVR